MDTGKVSRAVFEQHIAPHCGADRDDVSLGPTHGVDFGVLTVADRAVVAATDPVSILPALGFERAGRFALHVVLADVAVSGVPPSHLAISFSLPPGLSDDDFARVWTAIDAACRDLGVSVLTGHTARYEGAAFPWVGAATALAVGDPDDVVRPDGARPGDALLVTNGPAVEAVGLLTTLFPEEVPLTGEALSTAQSRLEEATCVRDALTAAAAGDVSAMHDATEGGLLGALHELADAAGVTLAVDADAVPVRPGVEQACAALGMDAWRATTSGTLLVTVDPDDTDAVLAALRDRGTSVAHVGRVEAGTGVTVDDAPADPPAGDASWPVYERLLAERED